MFIHVYFLDFLILGQKIEDLGYFKNFGRVKLKMSCAEIFRSTSPTRVHFSLPIWT